MKGRTYRYFKDALFPFGYGLSYTNFDIKEGKLNVDNKGNGTLNVQVTNKGQRDGDEIVQLYIRNPQDPDGPMKSLRAFQRVNVKAGATADVQLKLTNKSFEFWDDETNTMRVKPGRYELLYGNSSNDKDLKTININIQ